MEERGLESGKWLWFPVASSIQASLVRPKSESERRREEVFVMTADNIEKALQRPKTGSLLM